MGATSAAQAVGVFENGKRTGWLAAGVIALATVLAAETANALPALGDFYLGAGARSLGGTPGLSDGKDVRMALTLEAGVDGPPLFPKWGVGLRGDFNGGGKRGSLEIRYELIKFIGVHVAAGGALGLSGGKTLLDGSIGAFISGRLVLGFPYLAGQFGFYRSPGVDGEVSTSASLTGGISF